MLIEWLWKYEYFVNFKKMVPSSKPKHLLYCIWLLLTSWFLSPTIRDCLIYFSAQSDDSWFLWPPLNICPPSTNNDGPFEINMKILAYSLVPVYAANTPLPFCTHITDDCMSGVYLPVSTIGLQPVIFRLLDSYSIYYAIELTLSPTCWPKRLTRKYFNVCELYSNYTYCSSLVCELDP